MYSTGLDYCQDGCGGLWFDGGEIERVLKAKKPGAKAREFTTAPSGATRPCPACENETLQGIAADSKGEIEVDACPRCRGCWLDKGELEAIAAIYHSQGVTGLAAALPIRRDALKTPPKAYEHPISDVSMAVADHVAEDIVKPFSLYRDLFGFIGSMIFR